MRKDDVAGMRAFFQADETASFIHLLDRGQPLPVAAVAEGCSVAFLAVLLEHGVPADAEDNLGRTGLAHVAMTRLEEQQFEPAPWVVPTVQLACARGLLAPVAPLASPNSEQRLLALASCFLAFGADPERRDDRGVTPAEQAERSGNVRLSLFIKHWSDPVICCWIQKLLGPENKRPDMPGLPAESRDIVCSFLTDSN